MPVIFPINPILNQMFTANNGTTYEWDGEKWTVYASTGVSGAWVTGSTVWGATITAPTKATTRQTDYIRWRALGSKNWEIDWGYYAVNSAGAALGNGDYLFTLPGGLQFDTTLHKTYTGVLGTSLFEYLLNVDSGAHGYSTGTFGTTSITIIPYSATQYRVCYWEGSILRMINYNVTPSTTITANGYFLYYKFSFTSIT